MLCLQLVPLPTSVQNKLIDAPLSLRSLKDNYNLGLIFVVLIFYDDIIITKVIAEIWEHGNIAIMKSNKARIMSSQRSMTVLVYYDCTYILSVYCNGN